MMARELLSSPAPPPYKNAANHMYCNARVRVWFRPMLRSYAPASSCTSRTSYRLFHLFECRCQFPLLNLNMSSYAEKQQIQGRQTPFFEGRRRWCRRIGDDVANGKSTTVSGS